MAENGVSQSSGVRFGGLRRFVFRSDVDRPDALVEAAGTDVGVGTLRRVAHGQRGAGGPVTLLLKFEMKPHHELPGLLVVDDLGPFEAAAFRDFARGIVRHAERDSPILPIIQVGGRIDVDAHLGRVADFTGNLVFAKPVIDALVKEDAATVGIDGNALVVGP